MISIIDYKLGNIKAFVNIYNNLNIPVKLIKSYDDFDNVTKLILPGVGFFDHAMKKLSESRLLNKINKLVFKDKIPILGVCVGMQIMCKESEEGKANGLGWVDFNVLKFDESLIKNKTKLPHMGWNNIKIEKKNKIFNGLENDAIFYFLHSYYCNSNSNNKTIATSRYGGKFTCAFNYKNIYGVQFHPEKSHMNGIKLLHNFAKL